MHASSEGFVPEQQLALEMFTLAKEIKAGATYLIETLPRSIMFSAKCHADHAKPSPSLLGGEWNIGFYAEKSKELF